MNIYRFYEAKQQNRKICDLLRELDKQGRLRELNGKWHDHYIKFPKLKDCSEFYVNDYGEYRDKYIMNILMCSDTLNGHINSINKDVYITGARCCKEKICAVCGTKQARKIYSQMSWQFQQLKNEGYKYLFLTLTLPNNMHGFAEEYRVYKKCLKYLLAYLGFNNQFKDYMYGAFGTYELTHTKEKGWHPHLHLCLAYKESEIKQIDLDRFGQIKYLRVVNNYRDFETSALEIRDRFVKLIEKYFPEYYRDKILPYNGHLNIGFEVCYNIDDKCDELCKYFCDYNSIDDCDTLFEFMRDIYRFNKYVKVGCFHFTKAKEIAWNAAVSLPQRNLHFIQFDVNPSLLKEKNIYFGQYFGEYNGVRQAVNICYPESQVKKDVTIKYHRDLREYHVYEWVNDEYVVTYRFNRDDLRKMCHEPRKDISQWLYAYNKFCRKGEYVIESSG